MGISSPNVGYIGIAPSDDTLSIVTTERGTASSSWALLYSGLWVADVTFGSMIRLKIDMKVTPNAVIGEMLWKINDVWIWTDSTVNLAYESKTDDVTINWARGVSIKVYGRVQATSVLKLKNVELAGTVSPGVLWVA